MKNNILVIFIFVATLTCSGQTLFFDNLNNSRWKSEAYHNDSTIRISKKILLTKIKHPLDSLRVDVTLWTFSDGSLTIAYYDCHLKKHSLVATYKYAADADKGDLKIILNDNTSFAYDIGVAATGSAALLIRKKEKKKK